MIYCHSPEGNIAAALADRAFYLIHAHSAQSDNAVALVELTLSVCL